MILRTVFVFFITVFFRLSAFGSGNLYDFVVERDVMIPMRDGVGLATDIYRPARDDIPVQEIFPILLTRTPYNKTTADPSFKFVRQAEYFVQCGYVVAVQDCRGRYNSEGIFTKYVNEAEDGYDTIEWLAKVPYTNGKIGMWGTSYGAHTQASAAQLDPPHLKTIVLNMGGTYNGWDHAVRNHGVLEMKQLTWAFSYIKDKVKLDPVLYKMFEQERIQDWISAFPFKKGLSPLSVVPNFEDYIFKMIEHSNYDDYWKQLGLNWSVHYSQTADIPMLHIAGWYDSYCGTAINNYKGLSKIKKGPVRLLMGMWLHGKNDWSYAGEVEFGPEAGISDFNTDFHLRWFDYFLKGIDNGVEDEPAVQIFVMGTGDGHKDENSRLYHGGYWKKVNSWPLPGTEFTKYYFNSNGSLSTKIPVKEYLPITYTYDPHHPVPTIGGSTVKADPIYIGGAFDQRERKYEGDPEQGFFGSRPPYLPLKSRSDVVVFQTEPLEENVEVIGPITVVLYASSSAKDTDFTAKLIDVYPPSKDFPSGFEMNITDGIIRTRFRNSPAKPELMEPGEIYRFVIEPFPTANVFKKGHIIRIDVSSSNFPRFELNTNTGEPVGLSRRMVKADNSIHMDPEHLSHVVLPIIPVSR